MFLGLAGSLNYFGHGVLAQASFAVSNLLQAVENLTVSDLMNSSMVLHELWGLAPQLKYCSPPILDKDTSYLCFSYASHGTTSYEQSIYLSQIFPPAGCASVYLVLD